MPSYAAGPPKPARSGDVGATLWLMAYLALALAMMVLDHRGGWLNQSRQQASMLVQPLWMLAGMPRRLVRRPRRRPHEPAAGREPPAAQPDAGRPGADGAHAHGRRRQHAPARAAGRGRARPPRRAAPPH